MRSLCFLWFLASCAKEAAPESKARVAEIGVAVAEAAPFSEVVELDGTLAPLESASMAAEIEGRVTAVYADLGDRVQTGAPLARLNDDELGLAVDKAAADHEEAQRQLDRTEALAKANMASAAELDATRTRASLARTALAQARARLERATLRAPWPGVVAARLVSPGDFVRVGTPMFEVVQGDPLRLLVSVPEVWTGLVNEGTPVEVLVGDEVLRTEVKRLGPSVDPTSRSFPVEALIPNPDNTFKAGTFARVRLGTGMVAEAVKVPSRAVTTSSGLSRLFEIQGDKATERRVQVLADSGGDLIVTGVPAGATVASRGVSRLTDGATVRISAEKTP